MTDYKTNKRLSLFTILIGLIIDHLWYIEHFNEHFKNTLKCSFFWGQKSSTYQKIDKMIILQDRLHYIIVK